MYNSQARFSGQIVSCGANFSKNDMFYSVSFFKKIPCLADCNQVKRPFQFVAYATFSATLSRSCFILGATTTGLLLRANCIRTANEAMRGATFTQTQRRRARIVTGRGASVAQEPRFPQSCGNRGSCAALNIMPTSERLLPFSCATAPPPRRSAILQRHAHTRTASALLVRNGSALLQRHAHTRLQSFSCATAPPLRRSAILQQHAHTRTALPFACGHKNQIAASGFGGRNQRLL